MLPLKIALRYLFARKSHNAVNIISMVSLAGVAVATAAMVCVLSVFNGFARLADERSSMLNPDIRIERADRRDFSGADSLAAALARLPGVAVALPVVESRGLATYGDRQMAVTLVGVAPGWRSTVAVDSVVIDGAEAMRDIGATISVGAAVRLGARPDFYPRLGVYTPRRLGRINPSNPMSAFRADSLSIAEVYQSNQNEFDADRVYMPLDRLRLMLDYDSAQASAVYVALIPGADPPELTRLLGPEMRAVSRAAQNRASHRMIEIEKWISFVMLGFILLIASFNVISTLSMLIIEKRSSSSIMLALGATRSMVSRIFMWQGLLISLIGGLAGVILGSALTLAQQWGGFIKLGGDHTRMTITTYPVDLQAADLAAVMAIVAVIGALVALVASHIARR